MTHSTHDHLIGRLAAERSATRLMNGSSSSACERNLAGMSPMTSANDFAALNFSEYLPGPEESATFCSAPWLPTGFVVFSTLTNRPAGYRLFGRGTG